MIFHPVAGWQSSCSQGGGEFDPLPLGCKVIEAFALIQRLGFPICICASAHLV